MSKFKVGDEVMISCDSKWYGRGDYNPTDEVGILVEYDEENDSLGDLCYLVQWKNGQNSYRDEDLIRVNNVNNSKTKVYTNPPHKHRDLIIAWANGAEIEYYNEFHHKWSSTSNPSWCLDTGFRIKEISNQKSQQEIEKEIILKQMDELKGIFNNLC